MKISHIDLEQCRQRPRQWLAAKNSTGGGFTFGYNQALRLAISYYHKGNSAADAQLRLQQMITKHDFKSRTRVKEIKQGLDLYIKWCETSKTNTAESMIRIQLDAGGYLQLSGQISRVDVTTNGYRGVLLGARQLGWKTQLRMPLIQKALCERYGRPLESIEVGVQELDGSSLQTITFSSAQVRRAEEEFIKLGDTIKGLRA